MVSGRIGRISANSLAGDPPAGRVCLPAQRPLDSPRRKIASLSTENAVFGLAALPAPPFYGAGAATPAFRIEHVPVRVPVGEPKKLATSETSLRRRLTATVSTQSVAAVAWVMVVV